jgi:glycerol uptake facilitator-like aquaporin
VIDLGRRLVAEGLGTAALSAAVIGSGIMAERLTDDLALALLCNSVATGAALIVLCTLLGPISGAHLNPIVSLALMLRRELSVLDAALYALVQVAAAIAGAMLAHLMFEEPLLQLSTHVRTGSGQWLAEAVAAFGLLATILIGIRVRREAVPWLVGLFIVSAYWFTASTSFANPALTIARALTDSFAGIRFADVPGFLAAQFAGALAAIALTGWLLSRHERSR